MASKGAAADTKKNVMLISVAAVLLLGAAYFGLKDYLFSARPTPGADEAAANSDEVTQRITGGQPAMVEPDPPGPKPEPGSGRRANKPPGME